MTWFIQLYNDKPYGNPVNQDNLSYLLPNIDFSKVITPSLLMGTGYGMYEWTVKPNVTEKYKKAIEVVPVLHEDGKYYQTWDIVDMTPLERATADQVETEKVQGLIRQYLQQTDWTQLPDTSLSEKEKQAYRIYRQSLRDLNKDPDFPNNVLRKPTFDEFVQLQSVSVCDSPGFVQHSNNYNPEQFKFSDVTTDYLRSVYDNIMVNQPDKYLVVNVKFWFDILKDL